VLGFFYVVRLCLSCFGPFSLDCFYLVICFCCGVMYICTVPRGGSGVYFLVVILSELLCIYVAPKK
jgi:hypothetical protein